MPQRTRGNKSIRARTNDRVIPFAPPIESHDVFRQLIEEEIRNGRLSTSRRRRIVRYAAQLGLSATQAGRLIEASRAEFQQERASRNSQSQLRWVQTPQPATRSSHAPWIIFAFVLIAEYILLLRL